MSSDVREFLELQKQLIFEEKKRLGLLQDCELQYIVESEDDSNANGYSDKYEQYCDNAEKPPSLPSVEYETETREHQNFVEGLDLSSNDGAVEREKQAFIDKLTNSENPLTLRPNDSGSTNMLRYGEYSPNNPQLRVAAVPYLGLGEYEQRKQLIFKQRQADYQDYIAKKNELLKPKTDNFLVRTGSSKAVQTELQNIHKQLVQYDLHSQKPAEKELSPLPVIYANGNVMRNSNYNPHSYTSDQRLGSSSLRSDMNKPKSILSSRKTESPRERLMADLRHSYVPSFLDGFSHEDRSEHLERERIKREVYQSELRQQIEEKHRIVAMQDEQERREQEWQNRRFEQQLLKMQDDQLREEQRVARREEQMQRNCDDYIRHKQQELNEKAYQQKRADMQSSATNLRNTSVASKNYSHYSPPVSRRNPYSFNIPSTSVFANPTNRYNASHYDNYRKDNFSRRDVFTRSESLNRPERPRSRSSSLNRHESLSRIDSLYRDDSLNRLETLSIQDSVGRVPRRHSATQQDFSLVRSPKSYRSDRGSYSKFDDALPIPVLKAHSPVAKDLKNSVAIDSSRHSEALRKLEDKWQVPAVQKNIISHSDPLHEGHRRSILTQLGAIRMQLQKEQLKMDESLRKRRINQPKAV